MAALSLIFAANRSVAPRLLNAPFCSALEPIGTLKVVEQAAGLSEHDFLKLLQEHDIVLTGWGSRPVPDALAKQPGRVRYICHLTGEMRAIINQSIIDSSIPVTNWGDAPAGGIAEATLTLLLACLKNLRLHSDMRASGHWWDIPDASQGSLFGLNVGIYGMGSIARKMLTLLAPFEAVIHYYDPYLVEAVPNATAVPSLEALCRQSHALLIMAGLNDSTRCSINAARLALLPDHAVVINTARGAIIDEEALFAELIAGRLRAGLDVLTDDRELEVNHPVRSLPNVVITGHKLGRNSWPPGARLADLHKVALDNLQRFQNNQPLRFRMDARRYALSS